MRQNNGNDDKTVITNFSFCYWGRQLHCAIWGQYFNTTVQLHKDIIQWTIFSCNQETSGKNQHNMFVNLTLLIPTFFSYTKAQGEVKFHLPLIKALIVSQLRCTIFKICSKSKVQSLIMLTISKKPKMLLKKLEKLRWPVLIPSPLVSFF